MTEVRILALDPGHKLGYCVDDAESPDKIRTGVCELPRHGPDRGKTWCYLESWLLEMITQFRVTVLATEAPVPFGGRKGSTMATSADAINFPIGLAAVVELVGTRAGCICWAAPIATVRRHFTGSGKAGPEAKGRVYQRCRLLGLPVESLDAADATAIHDFCAHIYRRADLIPGPLFVAPGRSRSMRRPAPDLEVD
jgi:hypothetical protein